jgi:[acyl-carrier-protein] S-malonyltransferase
MATALLFPGQGSQTPGMRAVVEEVSPELVERAADVVGEDPFDRIDEGTSFAQPALYCASLALWLRAGSPPADVVAGHSLGELGALVAGESLGIEDGLRLAARRGRLMQEVAEHQGAGGMLAVLGSEEPARQIAAAHSLTVANDNAPGQLVLSGPGDELGRAANEAKNRGLKAIRLAVKGAFHTQAMAPALIGYSSITAHPFTDVRGQLADALVRPVRWRETLLALRDSGVDRFVEVGPGKVLKGLVRRTLADVEAMTLAELEVARA